MEKTLEKINQEWEMFCKNAYEEWKNTQPLPPIYIWNPNWMFDDAVRQERKWLEYIKPLGSDWWKERGYILVWPELSSDPLRVREID